jgi:glycosyltransferase involved in cell wall biosynthesis
METLRPKVSVGMPVYNGEKYLTHALTGILRQDYEDFELIITDNASTDETQQICLDFAQKDRRIRYVRNEANVGLAANHNRAFSLARGEFFKWAAHDDEFPRKMLGRFVQVFEESPPSVGLVYAHCEYIDEQGRIQGIDSDGVDNNDPRPHRRLAHFLWHAHMYNCPYGLIRSDFLRKTRLMGLYPMSDHVLFAELAMLGVFVEIPEPLLRIRRHPGRTFTANKTKEALRDLFTPGDGHKFSLLSLWGRTHLEVQRSALLIPPSLRDKMLCFAVALALPQWRNFKGFGGKQKRKFIEAFSRVAKGCQPFPVRESDGLCTRSWNKISDNEHNKEIE